MLDVYGCLTETYPFTIQKFYRIEPKQQLNILNIYQRDNSVLLYVPNASYSIVCSLMNIQYIWYSVDGYSEFRIIQESNNNVIMIVTRKAYNIQLSFPLKTSSFSQFYHTEKKNTYQVWPTNRGWPENIVWWMFKWISILQFRHFVLYNDKNLLRTENNSKSRNDFPFPQTNNQQPANLTRLTNALN